MLQDYLKRVGSDAPMQNKLSSKGIYQSCFREPLCTSRHNAACQIYEVLLRPRVSSGAHVTSWNQCLGNAKLRLTSCRSCTYSRKSPRRCMSVTGSQRGIGRLKSGICSLQNAQDQPLKAEPLCSGHAAIGSAQSQ